MSTYGLILLLSLLFPFLFSFERKRVYYFKKWPDVMVACFPVALFFIVWDVLVSGLGHWGFSEEHVFPFRFFHLPVEEILFFFVVPFSCVFILEVIKYFFSKSGKPLKQVHKFTLTAAVLMIIAAVVFRERHYTLIDTSVAVVVLVFFSLPSNRIVESRNFWAALTVTYLPFLLVNGVLTALPVVYYSPQAIIGFRVVTIPIEDFVYSFSMLSMIFWLYEYRLLKKKSVEKTV